MEAEILKFICSNQGSVNTQDLLFNLYPGDSAAVSAVLQNRDRFAPWVASGEPRLVARSRVRLCWARGCEGHCRGLHLCKNYLFTGSCHFTQLRRGCNFSHTLDSEHNQQILRGHELEGLSRAELCTLLLQNDNSVLPPICFDYNNGVGEFGRCQDGENCKRLHICEKYMNHDCYCTKNHDFTAPQALKALQNKGIPDSLLHSLKFIYANKVALRIAAKASDGGDQGGASNADARSKDGSRQFVRGRGRGGNRGNRGHRGNRANQGDRANLSRASSVSDIFAELGIFDRSSGRNSPNDDDMDTRSESGHSRRGAHHPHKTSAAVGGRGGGRGHRQLRDKTEICMYFIKGYCKHEDERCYKVHNKMPYRWEVNDGTQWTAMPDNEIIEKDYCDPKNKNSSTSSPVHFDTMTCGLNKVRRLSTVNSLIEPTFIHTTEWLWYWQDEFGNWNLYASDGGGHRPADMDSAKLEQKFLNNNKDEVEFTAGSQLYSLSFQDMIQTNKKYRTKRVVSRRPRFVSAEEVRTKKVRRPPLNSTAIPENWDRTLLPETGFLRIPLQRTSEEFKEIEALFCRTLTDFEVKVERIQNKALWEAYQLQKNHMKNCNGGRDVLEKKLFHGTDTKFLDAICRHNFDWRICGTHGTAYGKGSYFARDAKYSHSYTGASDTKAMFVCRVLVGDFARGSPEYLRPPSKDGGDVHFYDSCVDDVSYPAIYVIFEKHQIYPEYLLQYKKKHPLVDLYDTSTVTTQSLFAKTSVAPQTVRAMINATAPRPYIAPQAVSVPRPVAAPQPVTAPKPVTAPRPVAAPQPVTAPKPVTAPRPVAAPQPAAAPRPVAAPKPVAAPQPVVPPRQYVAAQPASGSSTLRSQSSYHRSGSSFTSSTASSSYMSNSSSFDIPSYSPPRSRPVSRKSSCAIM